MDSVWTAYGRQLDVQKGQITIRQSVDGPQKLYKVFLNLNHYLILIVNNIDVVIIIGIVNIVNKDMHTHTHK